MENNPRITVISVMVVLAVVMCGTYYMKTRSPGITNIPRPGAPLPEGPALEQRFVDFLNDFIKRVNEGMIAYKKERKILIQAMGPTNMREPAYVEENFNLVQTLIPSLRQKMADVIKIFEDAEHEVDQLLLNQPEPTRLAVLQKWTEMKRSQADVYIAYFTIENELLSAYEDLMRFYNDKKDAFEVDVDSRVVVFKEQADVDAEQRLRGRIAELYAEQEVLLNTQPKLPE
jgi:flagellar hook-basal body complex protein FliE